MRTSQPQEEPVVFDTAEAVRIVANSLPKDMPYRKDFRDRILRLEKEHPEIVEKALILIERDVLEAIWSGMGLEIRSVITTEAAKLARKAPREQEATVYKNLRNQAIRQKIGMKVLSVYPDDYGS